MNVWRMITIVAPMLIVQIHLEVMFAHVAQDIQGMEKIVQVKQWFDIILMEKKKKKKIRIRLSSWRQLQLSTWLLLDGGRLWRSFFWFYFDFIFLLTLNEFE